MEENKIQTKKTSMVNPSLEDLLKKAENPFFIVNMVIKRSNYFNLFQESKKAGKDITRAEVVTNIFQEIMENKITYSHQTFPG